MQDSLGSETSLLTQNALHPFFTDFYQFKMAYSYWKTDRHNDFAVFDVYFRKNPFGGEFTIFCGLNQVLEYLSNFRICHTDIQYLKTVMPSNIPNEFFEYLEGIKLDQITVYSVEEGTIVFPNTPLMTLTGPLATIQILETCILNFINFSSLVATNAAHFRQLVGNKIKLSEFGARRAQGPNGALTASVYSYVGGFDSTSNLLCGKMFGIPVSGTLAHSYISSYHFEKMFNKTHFELENTEGAIIDLLNLSRCKLKLLHKKFNNTLTNENELAAFVSFACSYPNQFFVVVDTYNIVKSGLPNFCATALALVECGYKPLGIRIDSGDLSYFSNFSRRIFDEIAVDFNISIFHEIIIAATNEISHDTVLHLNQTGHSIDLMGIGNYLATCKAQSSLGVVFKLVQVGTQPTIKVTEDISKASIPFWKNLYRLYDSAGMSIIDLITHSDEIHPQKGERIICRHPFNSLLRAYVIPSKVSLLHKVFFQNNKITQKLPKIEEIKQRVTQNLDFVRLEHKRLTEPIPYKVSLSNKLYDSFNGLLLSVAPISEFS